jgi:hypothetical protein
VKAKTDVKAELNTDGFFAVDFRLTYIKGLVPFFYEKKRPTGSRFSNTNSSVALRRLEDEFPRTKSRASTNSARNWALSTENWMSCVTQTPAAFTLWTSRRLQPAHQITCPKGWRQRPSRR